MTSFGWKAKRPKIPLSNTAKEFLQSATEADECDEHELVKNGHIDWLSGMQIKRKTIAALEDSKSKAERLKKEGTMLASDGRFWEAISKWDQAMQLIGQDAKLLDMKAQAFSELRELFPAVQTAELAVKIDPVWWESRQTLGRALLNLGELESAIVNFQKAILLNPANEQLWDDDLNWACKLLRDKISRTDVPTTDFSFTLRECMRVGIM